MAIMAHKAGTALQTGATATGITGTHTQTSSRKAAGELKIYFDTNGGDLAVYVSDPRKELSFDAVLEATVADKDIGDLVSVTSGEGASATTQNYLVTQWDVSEANDDVKKVSIGLRTTSLSAPSTAN